MAGPLTWRPSGPTRRRRSIKRLAAGMSGDRPRQGMLDTNILILRRWIDPAELPGEMAVSAITLAELSAGPHEGPNKEEQGSYDQHAAGARRLGDLPPAQRRFDPRPVGA